MKLTLLSLAVLLVSATPARGACVPLNSSITLFDEGDAASCAEQVDAAVALGNKRINILFTAHYRLDANQKLAGYCFRTDRTPCDAVTPEVLARMRGHWEACIKAAAAKVNHLSIYIQIDDAGTTNLWRNNLQFDPLAKHGGYSYDDILTRPIAELMHASLKPDARIEFSLQGEMGATLASHPASHVELIRLTKQRLAGRSQVEVGVNVNYTAVLGHDMKLSPAQVPQVQALLDATDFVGISTYHEVMVPVEASDFRFSYDMTQDELKALGVRIPAGKRTRISEIGMGGGAMADDGKTPGKTVAEVAASLWSGIRGEYKAALDPFRRTPIRDFRRDYYREMLAFLKTPPADLNLGSAYLWNSDSWDVQGFYPFTRGYEDATIVAAIKAHNAGCTP